MRRALLIPALLLAGFLLNLAIAWTASARLRTIDPAHMRVELHVWQRIPEAGEGRGRLRLDRFSTPATTTINSRTGPRVGAPVNATAPYEHLIPGWQRTLAAPWTRGLAPWPAEGNAEARSLRAVGFPFRSFWCELRPTNAANFRSHTWSAPGAFILGSATSPSWADWPPQYPVILPYRPLCRGLLANTLLYTALLAILLLAIRAFPPLRRHLRRRRGHCPRCGYDIQHNHTAPCPECGDTALNASTAAAPSPERA